MTPPPPLSSTTPNTSLCHSLPAMAESWKIHLVAVTSNGRRAYFTTSSDVRGRPGEERDMHKVPQRYDPRFTRPSTLVAVEARGPLPQAPVGGVRVTQDPNRWVGRCTRVLCEHKARLVWAATVATAQRLAGPSSQMILSVVCTACCRACACVCAVTHLIDLCVWVCLYGCVCTAGCWM